MLCKRKLVRFKYKQDGRSLPYREGNTPQQRLEGGKHSAMWKKSFSGREQSVQRPYDGSMPEMTEQQPEGLHLNGMRMGYRRRGFAMQWEADHLKMVAFTLSGVGSYNRVLSRQMIEYNKLFTYFCKIGLKKIKEEADRSFRRLFH